MKKRIKNFWNIFIEIINRQEMSVLPGHLAYYFLISTIPAITLIFYIASSLHLSFDVVSNFISSVFSPDISEMLSGIISETSMNFQNVFVLLLAFYVISRGAKSIINASNSIFGVENSNLVKKTIKSFIITIFLIILISFILIVPLFGETILKGFAIIGLDSQLLKVINIIYPVMRWPLTLFVVFLFIKFIYTIAPDESIPSTYVNRGSIFTTVAWSIVTALYSFYINNFTNYTRLYGTLSNIIILMLWFWLISYIFVIGLALNNRNAEMENERTSTIKLKEIQEKVKNNAKDKLK